MSRIPNSALAVVSVGVALAAGARLLGGRQGDADGRGRRGGSAPSTRALIGR